MATVLYEQKDRVVTITMNRPEVMNAIDPETHEALVAAWTRFRDDDSAWVAILTGAGDKAFSAGADLKKMIPGAFGGSRGYNPVSHTSLGLGGITRGLPIWKPMIAAINGFCLAGGLEQALACDLRIAAPHARFGLTEVRWAIMPGAGGTQRLPRAVPPARAMEMILTAEPISADEAFRLGLINKVVPLPELIPAARALADTLCERGPLALRAAKEAAVRGLSLPLDDGLRLEALLAGTLRGNRRCPEGPKAFAEKRKPSFKAR